MHVQKFGFTTLRKLNLFANQDTTSIETWHAWANQMEMHQAAQINIIIGRNGAGKSTILDMIDCIRYPPKLGSMQRENIANGTLAGFKLVFYSETLFVQFNSAQDGKDIFLQQHIQVGLINRDEPIEFTRGHVPRFGGTAEDYKEHNGIISKLSVKVLYFSRKARSKIDLKLLAEELCLAGRDLPGLISSTIGLCPSWPPFLSEDDVAYKKKNPVRVGIEPGVLNLWLDDDPLQENRVHVDQLPSGWIAYAEILSWLRSAPEGSVCLLEEPELHLHPTLQRRLIERIGNISRDRSQQLFIASHSPQFINTYLWGDVRTAIFQSRQSRITALEGDIQLVEELGFRASDILQANGVIWVEGATDRLYINHWIDLWCKENDLNRPTEDLDYTFVFYGGSSLSHFSLHHTEEFIKMLRLNRNLVVVMDRDLDFTGQPPLPVNVHSTKNRIKLAIEEMLSPNHHVWITDGYTIETYLPEEFLNKYFQYDAEGRLSLKVCGTKVNIARRFIKKNMSTSLKIQLSADIQKLVSTIFAWNQ